MSTKKRKYKIDDLCRRCLHWRMHHMQRTEAGKFQLGTGRPVKRGPCMASYCNVGQGHSTCPEFVEMPPQGIPVLAMWKKKTLEMKGTPPPPGGAA